jgi:hypothetical protein
LFVCAWASFTSTCMSKAPLCGLITDLLYCENS